jgi:sulfoxide reductase catalytic subunit YedY
MNADPARVDNSGFPITPIEGLGVTGNPPDVDIATYSLSVDGLVDSPLALTYQDLMSQPTVTRVVLLICPGFFAGNCEWTGVPLTSLLWKAGIKPGASQVVVHAMDKYSQAFSLDDIVSYDIFLAHTVDGQTLPAEHGYPARLVVKGKYGAYWVKWVDRIEVK